MPMKGNYIKLFRQITEWEHYQDGNTMRMFIHLLLMAVRNPTRYGKIKLQSGQFITTSRDLEIDLGMSARSVTQAIKNLRESGEIKTESCSGGTLFTVIHYSDYQGNPVKDDDAQKDSDSGYHIGGMGIGRDDF